MKHIMSIWNVFFRQHKRLFLTLTSILTAFFLLDSSQRVYVPRNDTLRLFQSPSIRSFVPQHSVAAIEKRLAKVLPVQTIEDSNKVARREIALQGVFSRGSSRFAIVALAEQGDRPFERRALRVGDIAEGWTVEYVGRASVSLRQGADTRQLVLFPGKDR